MAGPKLLPEIGTGLGNRRKAPSGLGFRGDPIKKPVVPLKPVATQQVQAPKSKRRSSKSSINDALKLREEIMAAAANSDTDQDQVLEVLRNSGIEDPEEIEAILGLTLNERAIRYFLKNTKNNPKKAMKLAEKFGY